MQFLEDKVIAVTGGGRGIGRATAIDAAKAGAKVVVADYGVEMDGSEPSSDVADDVVAEIKAAGGEAIAIANDVGSMAGGNAIIEAAMDTYGRIDGAVCVAGNLRERMLFNMSEEEWDEVIRVHLKGTFSVYRNAAAIMRKQDGGGSLIAFTSGVWALGSIAQPNYASAKGGIVSLNYSTAVAMQRYGVRSNVIAPVANTRMSANVPGGLAETGEPEDISPMAVYLLSDQSKEITGQVYTVVGKRISVWSQPKEVRSMFTDERWTPASIHERIGTTIKHEELDMFTIMKEMAARAAAVKAAEESAGTV